MPIINRETIEIAYQQGIEAVVLLIETLVNEQPKQIDKLVQRIEELENQRAKNSKNSDKPPSGDGFGKQTKSLRKHSDKKSGGQEGHKGQNLKWEETADQVIKHEVTECRVCGTGLGEIAGTILEKRQVHELPEIKLQVIEHQNEKKFCPECKLATMSKFPDAVADWVQYGERVKSLLTYLNQYQLIPSQRTQEIMRDVFGCEIGEGTTYNQVQKCHEVLEPVEQKIKEKLQNSTVVHFDETGMRVKSRGWWLHVSSSKPHTHYQIHQKRGQIAMDAIGILPNFQGNAVHDGFKSYSQYLCRHYLCNAHHLRELTFIHERLNQPWAEDMIKFLCNINDLSKQAKLEQKSALESSKISSLELEFQAILDRGYQVNPEPIPEPGAVKNRGRPKKLNP